MQTAISGTKNHPDLVIVYPRGWRPRLSRAPGGSERDRHGRVARRSRRPNARKPPRPLRVRPVLAAKAMPRTDPGPADPVPVRARPGRPQSNRPSRPPEPAPAVWCARQAPSPPAAPAHHLTRSARSDRARQRGPTGRAASRPARDDRSGNVATLSEVGRRSLQIEQCRAGGDQRCQVGWLEKFVIVEIAKDPLLHGPKFRTIRFGGGIDKDIVQSELEEPGRSDRGTDQGRDRRATRYVPPARRHT